MRYRSRQGDVLDAIAARFYGVGGFDIGVLYDANPALAETGPVLPAGIIVTLPEQAKVRRDTQRAAVRLWD